MVFYPSGPINLQQGQTYSFTLAFFGSSGNLVSPTSAGLIVSYTNTAGSTQNDIVTLTPSGSIFTGTWPSTSAPLGLANWVATPSSGVVVNGQIRVVNFQIGD